MHRAHVAVAPPPSGRLQANAYATKEGQESEQERLKGSKSTGTLCSNGELMHTQKHTRTHSRDVDSTDDRATAKHWKNRRCAMRLV